MIIAEAPESPAAMRARMSLPSALANAGREADAVNTWLAYSEVSQDPEDKAMGYYNAAMMLAGQGNEHYPEAMMLGKKVLEEYPKSRYLPYVKSMMEWLKTETQVDLIDTLGI